MSSVITLEGGLFAADLIDTLATDPGSIAGQRPEDFGMAGLRLSDEMQSLFSQLQGQWDRFERRRLAASDTAVSITREAWLLPVLRLLDFDPQYQRANIQLGGQSYPISHLDGEGETAIPVHVAAFDDDLDRRGDRQRFSPHALVQDYLNRSDSLWGIVTNGRRLRVLRNTTRLARPVYLELDLEGIAAGNQYAEFARLFRLIHRSRFPAQGTSPDKCLLETWYLEGVEQGGRVRERLREGVEKALEIFGTGLLEHPNSTALLHHLEQGSLSPEAYYRQLLRLVYRLLFLMVAEERRLLFVDDPDKTEHQRLYTNWYSIEHLRERAMGRRGRDPHGDLWQGLCQAFRLFREEDAAADLGLGVLDGELFSIDACQMLEAAHLRNDRLLDAVFRLSTFQETEGRSRRKRGTRRRVSFAALDVEELGSVYESLLDFHPHIDTTARRFALVGGSERKTTGSYYTPKELVAELIKSALEPVLAERVRAAASTADKERAILAMRVIDPACGSGHFLLAAARRMGRELARVRSGENEPSPRAHREAVRDVIRHCIYAVDKNPLAVDLCKVALWIESHTAGLPLSFLDHHVRRGDALIGVMDLDVLKNGIPDAAYKPLTGDDKATASELRKRNKVEAKDALQHYYDVAGLESFARAMAELDAMPEDGIADIAAKTRRYRALHDGNEAWSRMKQACDLYCAAFFMPKTPATARLVPTRAHLRDALSGRLHSQVAAHLLTLADEQRFFHWPLEFPEVLQAGGFDVVLGNPPWERIKLQEQEFFAARDSEIANALNKSARGKLIAALKSAPEGSARRVLHNAFEIAKRAAEAASEFVRNSGRFPLTAVGDVNAYALFAEHFFRALNDYRLTPVGLVR